ncbi:hypothetical protein MUO32_26200 [Shinella sp. CPCC 101442]|jgi:hypothetical protein|uniref:hypothetical protein n=1 Tax=Shinella sp. CPCC 101442 TaxID=2932265 RepID=UPI00215225A4|nr:hypothetical protein [Shinella sp. CPCC 101442]MCR6502524.1 hypothetical protein [Shinella sp. CPCC 101442]
MTKPDHELNAQYGAMISPGARVAVPDEWMPAVHQAMQEFCDLPTEVRAFTIVIGILRDAEGDITFQIACARELVSDPGMKLIDDIIARASAATAELGVRN